MARARNIKPGICKNEDLAACTIQARYLSCVLPCFADREGRLEDRPLRLKIEIFPADDGIDVDALLNELVDAKYIVRYEVEEVKYIQIVKFKKHQSPHVKEKASTIPAPDKPGANTSPAPPVCHDSHDCHDSVEPNGSSAEVKTSPAVFEIPLTRGKTHDVTQEDISRYRQTFPAVDVSQSFRTMLAWLEANPKRKSGTVRGAKSRITSWLSRDQDKAAKGRASPKTESDEWLRGVV